MESSPFWPPAPNRNTDNSVQREKPGTSDGRKRAGACSLPTCLPAPPGHRWPQRGCSGTGSKERSVHPHSGAGGGHPACPPAFGELYAVLWLWRHLPHRRTVRGRHVSAPSASQLRVHEMEVRPAQPAVTRTPAYLAPRTRDRKGPCLRCQSAQGQSCESVTSC